MKKRLLLLILSAILVSVCIFASCADDSSAGGTDTDKTDAATETDTDAASSELTLVPDFTVYDADGNPVKLSDMRGKPVILNFWASWCGPCKNEMPDFNDAYLKYGGEVVFMMVNLTDGSTETVKTASDFIASQGYEFPVYFDTDGEAAGRYGISSIPTTFVIDENGYGVGYATGMIDAETLEYAIGLVTE